MKPESDTDAALTAMFTGTVPDDDGFSARLVARLPRRRNPWRRLLLAATVVAGALPAILLPAPAVAQADLSMIAAALALAAIMAVAWIGAEAVAPVNHHS